MSLALSLSNALTGLNVSQQSLAVLSQNIANANTYGYSRKILSQQAVYLDGQGAGVSILDVSRKVDEYLLRSARLQSATLGRTSAMVEYGDRTQLLLGSPGAANSIDAYITNFFNAVQALANAPESSTLQVGLLNNSGNLAQQTRQLARNLLDLRVEADRDIGNSIATINRRLAEIHELNRIITQDSALGKSVADLLDRRDVALRDLSQHIDIQTFSRAGGAVNVTTATGLPLLDESLYRLEYSPVTSSNVLLHDAPLVPINIQRLDSGGRATGRSIELVSGGVSGQATSLVSSGRLKALLDLRDRQIPNMMSQLDLLAATLRDQFNRIHNTGTGYPGARSLTGARAVFGESFSQWSGAARIALLGSDGRPTASPYPGEDGYAPLFLDLENLNTGQGAGYPSVQGIINEINQHFAPRNKVQLGNLNNIRLASATSELPASPQRFTFDFDLENISGDNADFFVTGFQVLDNTGVDITSVTQDVPQIPLEATGTYITTADSSIVTVTGTLPPGVEEGQRIYLSTPPVGVDGIPAGNLGGYFVVSNVSGNTFQIDTGATALAGGSYDMVGQVATPPYSQAAAGTSGRTTEDGQVILDLSGNDTSPYYTIVVDMAVDDGNGNLSTSQVTYRIENTGSNLFNQRYAAQAATDDGEIVEPSSTVALARAILVDENGVELPRSGGLYTNAQQGYLKIVTAGSDRFIAIDSLDSAEEGRPNGDPPTAGTDRDFSYFFELNNFFQSRVNEDDPITGSALALDIEQRLLDDPSLIALGRLVQSAEPADPNLSPLYTYERHVSDGSIMRALAELNTSVFSFAAAGGISATTASLSGYAGAIIGVTSATNASWRAEMNNAQTLMDGYDQRADAISGVNLDEELANTIVYQNSYTASARVISVTATLFDALLNSVGR